MPTVKIPPGVIRAETREAVPGRWHKANLIRWSNGVMTPIGGWDRMTGEPLNAIPRHSLVYRNTVGQRGSVTLCDDKVFGNPSDGYIDITPPDFSDANFAVDRVSYGSGSYGLKNYGSDAEERGIGAGGFDMNRFVRFSADMWGDNEALFATSADGRIWSWDVDTPNVMPVLVAAAPTFIHSFIVTDEHHVMTFRSQGFPNRIAWSDQDNRNGWDYERVEGQAGFYDLAGAGSIIAAYKIPGSILVFTDTGVWLGSYIGQPYYYGFRNIAEGCAPMSAHSIAAAGSRVFWMGKKGFWKYEGGVVSILPHPLGTDIFEGMDPMAPRRACAGYNGLYPEIWFFYPSIEENGDLSPALRENDKYVVYSFQLGNEWWADGNMSRTFFQASPIDLYPIGGSPQTHLYQHEKDYGGDGRDVVTAEVSSLSFDNGESNFSVHQCQLNNSGGYTAIEFDFSGTYVRGGPVYELQKGLRGREDGFLDTRFTARDLSMKITGVEDVNWGLGEMLFSKVKRRAGR